MSIKQMKDGRWYASTRYKNFKGEVKQKTKTGFKLKREAQAWLDEFRREANSNYKGMTYKELCQRYLEDMKDRGLKRTTVYSRKNMLRNICNDIGDRPIEEISTRELREYVKTWQGHLNISTQKTIISTIHATFHFAIERYGLPKNPCQHLLLKKTDAPPQERPFWTAEQFEIFDRAMRQYSKTHQTAKKYSVMFYLAFWTGVRKGELLALYNGTLVKTIARDFYNESGGCCRCFTSRISCALLRIVLSRKRKYGYTASAYGRHSTAR